MLNASCLEKYTKMSKPRSHTTVVCYHKMIIIMGGEAFTYVCMVLNSTTVPPDNATLEMIGHNHAVGYSQLLIVDDFFYL